MAVAKYDPDLCERCEVCNAILACPADVITRPLADDVTNKGLIKIDEKRCLGCGKCERFCRGKAIKMV